MAATIKDISKMTGLSIATISKYLNGGNVLEQNRKAIEEAIEQLDFTVNEFARSLKTSKSRTIGILIPNLSNTFSTNLIAQAEDMLRNQGYSVIISSCKNDVRLEKECTRFLISKMVDGIISIPVSSDGSFIEIAQSKNVPIVLVDRYTKPLLCDCVIINNHEAAREATQYLINNGHRRIAFLGGDEQLYTSLERYNGYLQALQDSDITLDEKLCAFGDLAMESGYNLAKQLLLRKDPPTAIFVAQYRMTLGAIMAINELGVRIPEDVSVIGFDNLEQTQIVNPPLTLVSQPLHEIARCAVDMLLRRVENREDAGRPPQLIKLATQLYVRGSVRAV